MSPWLRVNESRLSYSTASNPCAAQVRVQVRTIPIRRLRFAGVRMSISHSPHALSTTTRPLRCSSAPIRCFQKPRSLSWVWNPLT